MRKLVMLLLLGSASPVSAQTTRVVTTYIDQVQDERKSTRWTLTEWLRIKERMKLMDVWLAMFSTPQQKFAPELSFSYFKGVGESKFDVGSDADFANDKRHTLALQSFEEGRMQFWFTNLVTSTTGFRTLDIDLGLEGQFHNRFMDGDVVLGDPLGGIWTPNTEKLQQAGVNLRLFGANSQDSTLVAKYGKFDRDTGFLQSDKQSGQYWGAEMSLYLLSILGAEGNYYQYMIDETRVGSKVDYFGFLEFYNFRVGYGQSVSSWEWTSDLNRIKSVDTDRFIMARLYF